jgi:DNA-binding response OmpR family regulator
MSSDVLPAAAADDANQPATILIVEDDPFVASFIEEILTESGLRVVGIASTGNEALSLAEEIRPHLALVDIRLSGPLDGIELACLMRDKFDVPAIFLSGLSDPDTQRRAQAAQALGFLHKPFRPSEVFNVIDRALQQPSPKRLASG